MHLLVFMKMFYKIAQAQAIMQKSCRDCCKCKATIKEQVKGHDRHSNQGDRYEVIMALLL
jgi:hypothetical protein